MTEDRQGKWMAAVIMWMLFLMVIVTLLVGWVLFIWFIGDLVL